jgi:hypothetical protein
VEKPKKVYLSSDWETATGYDIKTYIRLIESMNESGIVITSRIGNYEETMKYLKERCKNGKNTDKYAR